MLSVHTCPLAILGGKRTGGMNVYVRELSRELGRRGWAVDVFTHAENPCRPIEVGMAGNVRVMHVVAGPERHIAKNELVRYLPEFADNVRAFAEERGFRYDLIHSHYWLSGLVARDLQRDWSVPIVQMFHTLGHIKNRVARSPGEHELQARIEAETELIRHADALVASTPIERRQMLDLYGADPSRISVIPCGADLGLFRPLPKAEARHELGLPADRHLILFVGRIDPLKGIDTLLKAIALILKESPAWHGRLGVVIVGGQVEDNPRNMSREMQNLHALRESLGIEETVTFLGSQSQEALPYFYSAADVVVMPSHYESFGMVALESMASGTPVIASNVGGLSYIVRHGKTGYLVPPRSPKVLAGRIRTLLDDPFRRRRMGAQGVQAAQRYSWTAVSDQIESLYADLIPVRCCTRSGINAISASMRAVEELSRSP
jgi:D-inositol-3-phosphate glycosyltransferase